MSKKQGKVIDLFVVILVCSLLIGFLFLTFYSNDKYQISGINIITSHISQTSMKEIVKQSQVLIIVYLALNVVTAVLGIVNYFFNHRLVRGIRALTTLTSLAILVINIVIVTRIEISSGGTLSMAIGTIASTVVLSLSLLYELFLKPRLIAPKEN